MSSHTKTFFVERTDFSFRMARVVGGSSSRVLADVQEIEPTSPEEIKAFVQKFTGEGAGNLTRAYCSIYPTGRIVRNIAFKDGPQVVDTDVINQVITDQLQINPSEYGLAVLNIEDGTPFVPGKVQKDLLVCGAPRDQLAEAQNALVEAGIYPLRIELGSVATIGLLLNGLRTYNGRDPVLVVEMGHDSSRVWILSENRLASAKFLPLGLNSMIAGVRKELGLQDEQAAKRLFYSDSFDFREMGPRLIDRLLRELQSMIGFYEVQTGQSITRMLGTLLPPKLTWLNETFATSLGMSKLEIDFPAFLGQANLSIQEMEPPLQWETLLGLLGLMVDQEVVVS